jgi:hypothetical protein
VQRCLASSWIMLVCYLILPLRPCSLDHFHFAVSIILISIISIKWSHCKAVVSHMIVSNPAAIKLSPKFPKFQDLGKFQKQLLLPGVRDLVTVWIWGLHYLWILWQSHNKGKQWISHQKIVHTRRSSSLSMCRIHRWQWWTPHMHNLLMSNFMKLWYCLTLG